MNQKLGLKRTNNKTQIGNTWTNNCCNKNDRNVEHNLYIYLFRVYIYTMHSKLYFIPIGYLFNIMFYVNCMFWEMGVLTTATFLQMNIVDISVYLFDHQLIKNKTNIIFIINQVTTITTLVINKSWTNVCYSFENTKWLFIFVHIFVWFELKSTLFSMLHLIIYFAIKTFNEANISCIGFIL